MNAKGVFMASDSNTGCPVAAVSDAAASARFPWIADLAALRTLFTAPIAGTRLPATIDFNSAPTPSIRVSASASDSTMAVCKSWITPRIAAAGGPRDCISADSTSPPDSGPAPQGTEPTGFTSADDAGFFRCLFCRPLPPGGDCPPVEAMTIASRMIATAEPHPIGSVQPTRLRSNPASPSPG